MIDIGRSQELMMLRRSRKSDVTDYTLAAPLHADWSTSTGTDMFAASAIFGTVLGRQCVTFNTRTRSYIATGLNSAPCTVCLWVCNPALSSGTRAFFASLGRSGGSTSYTTSFERNTNDTIRVLWHNSYANESDGTYSFSAWTHIALAINAEFYTMWVNGEMVRTNTPTWLSSVDVAYLYLNSNGANTSVSEINSYHDLRLYPRILTTEEVRRIRTATK